MQKKPFHSDNRPGKKSFGKKDDKPSRKSFEKGEDKPFRKSFEKRDDKLSRKSFEKRDDKPFRKSFEKGEDKPFRKSFEKGDDKPFRKSFEKGDDKPFRKSFEKGDDKPFRKSFEKRDDKPFRKSFEKGEDKPFRKSFEKREDKPFRKSFEKRDDKLANKQTDNDKEEKRPNRYANAFGKLDDNELAAHLKKQKEKREQKEQQEEVTFSKELVDKWSEEPRERSFAKGDKKKAGKEELTKKQRHSSEHKFKKQFDKESPYARASSFKTPKEEETEVPDAESQLMPLNKYIAHCDVCSRRDAVTLIKEGKVTVNGALVTEPGHKVTINDVVTLNGEKLTIQKNLVYILMNKPKGFITTTDDPKGRHTVMELIDGIIEERVFPVGRLDRNTTGLLLLTNDGELAQKLAHPKYDIKKVYKATLDKNLSKVDFDKIKEGVVLEDGKTEVDQLEYLDQKNEIGMEIHSGKNRIVRRIFESLGYEVEKLDRVMYAGLTKKNVLRGKWRFLTKQEVINLKHLH